MTKRNLAIVLAVIVIVVAIFCAGYSKGRSAASAKYEALIAQAKTESAKSSQALEAKYRLAEEQNAKKVSAALAARDEALSRVASLRASTERLRVNSESLSKSLSAAAAKHSSSSDRNEVKLGRCERLLSESADLLGEGQSLAAEGAELSVRVAADKDAILMSVQ